MAGTEAFFNKLLGVGVGTLYRIVQSIPEFGKRFVERGSSPAAFISANYCFETWNREFLQSIPRPNHGPFADIENNIVPWIAPSPANDALVRLLEPVNPLHPSQRVPL